MAIILLHIEFMKVPIVIILPLQKVLLFKVKPYIFSLSFSQGGHRPVRSIVLADEILAVHVRVEVEGSPVGVFGASPLVGGVASRTLCSPLIATTLFRQVIISFQKDKRQKGR